MRYALPKWVVFRFGCKIFFIQKAFITFVESEAVLNYYLQSINPDRITKIYERFDSV